MHFVQHRAASYILVVLEALEAGLVSWLAVLIDPFCSVLHLVEECQVPVGLSALCME